MPAISKLSWPPYYGWWVLFASFVAMMLVNGSTVFLFGLMVVPAADDLGISRSVANQGYIIYLIGMTFWGAVAGWIVDRVSARIVIPAGALLVLGGFGAISATENLLLMAALLFGPIALGACLAGIITGSAVTSRWFRRRRGRALGIFTTGSSFAGVALSPLNAVLIQELGWRGALLIIGIFLASLIVFMGVVVIRDRPSEEELRVEVVLSEEVAEKEAELREWSFRDLTRNLNFYLILCGIGLVHASDQVLLISKVPYMHDRGVSLTAASLIVSAQSASAFCGKLLVGYLSEKISIIRIYAVLVSFHLLLLTLYIIWPGYWFMLIASACIGVAIGGVFPVKLIIIAKAFGSRSYAFVMGLTSVGTQIFSVTAIYLSGLSYDFTGTYQTTFMGLAGAVTVSFLLISRVKLRDTRQAST